MRKDRNRKRIGRSRPLHPLPAATNWRNWAIESAVSIWWCPTNRQERTLSLSTATFHSPLTIRLIKLINSTLLKSSSIWINFFFTAIYLTGYETRFGYVDVKSNSGVYFYVQRNTTYSTNNSSIPYEFAHLNIGGAMDLATGVFTAPTNGRYQFNFVALANADITGVIFRLNGFQIAYGLRDARLDNPVISSTLELQKNDRIDTYLSGGSIHDCSTCYYAQFTWILLEEDLVLSHLPPSPSKWNWNWNDSPRKWYFLVN